ncbi:unnamed protein product [Symbiodinium sp. KB8]|nr:unnamed protein product [Symbiodinium sp. KB8]
MCRLCLGYGKRTRQDLTNTINTLKDQLRQLVGCPSLVAPDAACFIKLTGLCRQNNPMQRGQLNIRQEFTKQAFTARGLSESPVDHWAAHVQQDVVALAKAGYEVESVAGDGLVVKWGMITPLDESARSKCVTYLRQHSERYSGFADVLAALYDVIVQVSGTNVSSLTVGTSGRTIGPLGLQVASRLSYHECGADSHFNILRFGFCKSLQENYGYTAVASLSKDSIRQERREKTQFKDAGHVTRRPAIIASVMQVLPLWEALDHSQRRAPVAEPLFNLGTAHGVICKHRHQKAFLRPDGGVGRGHGKACQDEALVSGMEKFEVAQLEPGAWRLFCLPPLVDWQTGTLALTARVQQLLHVRDVGAPPQEALAFHVEARLLPSGALSALEKWALLGTYFEFEVLLLRRIGQTAQDNYVKEFLEDDDYDVTQAPLAELRSQASGQPFSQDWAYTEHAEGGYGDPPLMESHALDAGCFAMPSCPDDFPPIDMTTMRCFDDFMETCFVRCIRPAQNTDTAWRGVDLAETSVFEASKAFANDRMRPWRSICHSLMESHALDAGTCFAILPCDGSNLHFVDESIRILLQELCGFESAVGTFAFRQGMATMQVSCFVPAARISNFQDRKLQTLKEKRQKHAVSDSTVVISKMLSWMLRYGIRHTSENDGWVAVTRVLASEYFKNVTKDMLLKVVEDSNEKKLRVPADVGSSWLLL